MAMDVCQVVKLGYPIPLFSLGAVATDASFAIK